MECLEQSSCIIDNCNFNGSVAPKRVGGLPLKLCTLGTGEKGDSIVDSGRTSGRHCMPYLKVLYFDGVINLTDYRCKMGAVERGEGARQKS